MLPISSPNSHISIPTNLVNVTNNSTESLILPYIITKDEIFNIIDKKNTNIILLDEFNCIGDLLKKGLNSSESPFTTEEIITIRFSEISTIDIQNDIIDVSHHLLLTKNQVLHNHIPLKIDLLKKKDFSKNDIILSEHNKLLARCIKSSNNYFALSTHFDIYIFKLNDLEPVHSINTKHSINCFDLINDKCLIHTQLDELIFFNGEKEEIFSKEKVKNIKVFGDEFFILNEKNEIYSFKSKKHIKTVNSSIDDFALFNIHSFDGIITITGSLIDVYWNGIQKTINTKIPWIKGVCQMYNCIFIHGQKKIFMIDFDQSLFRSSSIELKDTEVVGIGFYNERVYCYGNSHAYLIR